MLHSKGGSALKFIDQSTYIWSGTEILAKADILIDILYWQQSRNMGQTNEAFLLAWVEECQWCKTEYQKVWLQQPSRG